MGSSRDESVYMAKLAEQAERYDEMVRNKGVVRGEHLELRLTMACSRPDRGLLDALAMKMT